MGEPITLAVVGAGNRGGDVYGGYVLRNKHKAKVVAVAESDATRRERFADLHNIGAESRYSSWEQLLARPRLADGLIVATPDRMHVEPALQALRQGYDVLLEKPIAPTREGTLQLAKTAQRSQGSLTIAHVLRYTPFFTRLKELLDEGRIGRLLTIQHTENIGYWHFVHSFVRGNWRRSDTSSPMILAKSCHDLDILRWFAGAPCEKVSSFGALSWFRRENKPHNAPSRCIDGCPVGDVCSFNAVTFYVDGLAGHNGWPVSVVTADTSREGRLEALRTGPYGRCVYECDNDAPDHQVAQFQFANGITATLTITAFTEENTRTLKLMGSGGEIRGHLEKGELQVRTFGKPGIRDGFIRSGIPYETIETVSGSGHAGGDDGLMDAFVDMIRRRKQAEEPGPLLTSAAESLESHLMAFAAEQSRLTAKTVTLQSFGN